MTVGTLFNLLNIVVSSLSQALDGHKFIGDRRDSLYIFKDSSKEGLLNFRQLATDKNKV